MLLVVPRARRGAEDVSAIRADVVEVEHGEPAVLASSLVAADVSPDRSTEGDGEQREEREDPGDGQSRLHQLGRPVCCVADSTVSISWLVAVMAVMVFAAACRVPVPNNVTQTGTGSPATDLDKLRRIVEESAAAAGVSVAGKPQDGIETCQRPSDGSPGNGARLTYSIALAGATPEEVSTRVASFWRQKGSEWFGPDVIVDGSHIAEKGKSAQVYGGGWDVIGAIPLNETHGAYALIATGPCY